MKRKPLFKSKERGFPGHSNPPQPPQQPQQNDLEFLIPFTIPEIDLLMQTLIELNAPIQTYILLDSKFQSVKVEESRTFSSKINEEAGTFPDWEAGVLYRNGDKYVKRDPFGVFEIINGQEIEITVNQDLADNGPGEIN